MLSPYYGAFITALLGSARLREDHAIEQVVGGKRQAVDWAQAL
jgi:hypothetical protein